MAAPGASVSAHSPAVASTEASAGSRASSARRTSSTAQPAATAVSGTAPGRPVPAASSETSSAASNTTGAGANRLAAVTALPSVGSEIAPQQHQRDRAQEDLDVQPDGPVR